MDHPRRSSGGTPKSSAQLGNLTGPARVLNDVIVSIHNSIQKWNEAYLHGVKIIQGIQENRGDDDQFQLSCEKIGSLVDILKHQSALLQTYSLKIKNLNELQDASKMKYAVSWTCENFGN